MSGRSAVTILRPSNLLDIKNKAGLNKKTNKRHSQSSNELFQLKLSKSKSKIKLFQTRNPASKG
jgi:hypothetical protein